MILKTTKHLSHIFETTKIMFYLVALGTHFGHRIRRMVARVQQEKFYQYQILQKKHFHVMIVYVE